ncbi:hypothetical protein ACS0TY_035887 [Phlomoides rotata]
MGGAWCVMVRERKRDSRGGAMARIQCATYSSCNGFLNLIDDVRPRHLLPVTLFVWRTMMRRWLCCTCQVEESYHPHENEHLKSPRNNADGRKGVQGSQPGPTLDWMQRVRIVVDAARGLEYLHEKVQSLIVHRDIRSNNVLLFEDYKAKIADFNLSNQAPDTAASLHSTRVLGAFGYHAPE